MYKGKIGQLRYPSLWHAAQVAERSYLNVRAKAEVDDIDSFELAYYTRRWCERVMLQLYMKPGPNTKL